MAKRLVILCSALALVAGGWAEGGWGADTVGDGGAHRECLNGWVWEWQSNTGWRPTGQSC